MIIKSPQKRILDDKCRVECIFTIHETEKILYYDFPKEYYNFLVTENCDAFLVGLVLLAMKNGENIEIDGKVSAKLYYNLLNYFIPIFSTIHDHFSVINLKCKNLNYSPLESESKVGTGVSCGVDSMSTIFSHLNDEAYPIDYLVYLNAGSHGHWADRKSKLIFKRRLDNAMLFSERIGKNIIEISTNLSELIQIEFQSSHSIRNLSCILNLQNLFSHYIYASAQKVQYHSVNSKDGSGWDIYINKLLETETISFSTSMVQYSRFERVKLISNEKEVNHFLDVCVSPDPNAKKLNCSRCYKCLRTLISLELIGKLHEFSEVFDMETYNSHRDLGISEIILKRKENVDIGELYSQLKKYNKIKVKHLVMVQKMRIDKKKKNIKQLIKSK